MTDVRDLKIGVVLEAFLDRPLDEVLQFLRAEAPDVTMIEVGAGGYAPHPHCDVTELLASADARREWRELLDRYDLGLDALNAWGNPLHPDAEIAARHDAALRNAIRLATELGSNRVVAMSGCPAARAGDSTPHFGAGGWLPYLEGVHDRQWTDGVAAYWADLAAFAESVNPAMRVCIELHPGTTVYNVTTFEKFAALGPSLAANLDPSHFFWMQMDGHRVTERIRDRIAHVHAKDTSFNDDALALNGLLDHRWPTQPEAMPWNFSVPGRGHGQEWWNRFVQLLDGSQAHVISIEHEDPFVPPTVGIPEAAKVLRRAIDQAYELVAAS